MSYLINEALLRLIKPVIALVLGLILYWRAHRPDGRARFGAAGPGLLDLGGCLHPARGDRRHLGAPPSRMGPRPRPTCVTHDLGQPTDGALSTTPGAPDWAIGGPPDQAR